MDSGRVNRTQAERRFAHHLARDEHSVIVTTVSGVAACLPSQLVNLSKTCSLPLIP